MNNQIVAVKKEEHLSDVESLQVNQADNQDTSTSKRQRDNPEPEINKEESPAYKKEDTTPGEPENETDKVIPMNRDSWFYCRRCNENIKGCREYYSHIKSAHNITPKIKGIKYLDVQPDVDDPNFYCRSCEKPHTNKNFYNIHLRRIHHMLLPPLIKPKKSAPSKSYYYCEICEIRIRKTSFKRHMLSLHNQTL
ncbi:hypothetical protein BD408DRAFT_482528 [Parasitella parasitica]|nr:hypothetical protein BD408DRAFT_482528 [Parasitella parasitica]